MSGAARLPALPMQAMHPEDLVFSQSYYLISKSPKRMFYNELYIKMYKNDKIKLILDECLYM